MTAREALAVLDARLAPFQDEAAREALDVLRGRVLPKPRASKPGACPIARAALKACSGIGVGVSEEAAYLDTFGEPGSPERKAQWRRLRALPVYSQFSYEGMPAKLAKDEGAASTYLFGHMAEMERQDEEAREARAREAKVIRETQILRYWAYRHANPDDPAVRARARVAA